MQNSDTLISELVALAPIKTWSLIVSLFGDLDGETLTGTEIKTFLGRVGIKPEAIRVAMHRLKKEDWVVAEKRGREAVYRLSSYGLRETRAAHADVYRQDSKFNGGWRVLLTDGDEAIKPPCFAISRDIALAPPGVPTKLSKVFALQIVDQQVPQWLQNRLLPQPLIAVAENLAHLVEEKATHETAFQPLDRAVLRLLVLHHWRRIALRSGCWALISLMPDGQLARCHRVVTQYLVETDRISAAQAALQHQA